MTKFVTWCFGQEDVLVLVRDKKLKVRQSAKRICGKTSLQEIEALPTQKKASTKATSKQKPIIDG